MGDHVVDDGSKHYADGTKPRGWVHLTEGKEFSRLLYPNPVCFLCTTRTSFFGHHHHHEDHSTTTHGEAASSNESTKANRRNVMVISWLTAIDNNGYFIMSVNSRRHSVNHLLRDHRPIKKHMASSKDDPAEMKSDIPNDDDDLPATTFTLCVPTAEMTDLVLQVGGVSGKDHCKFGKITTTTTSPKMDMTTADATMSKRKRRKLQKQRLEAGEGISGLVGLPYGHIQTKRKEGGCGPRNEMANEGSSEDAKNEDECNGIPESDHLFVIQGTVAHMKCQIQSLLLNHHQCISDISNANTTTQRHQRHNPQSNSSHLGKNDKDSAVGHQGAHSQEIIAPPNDQVHHVFLAKVMDAYCHEDYWDSSKLLFCAKHGLRLKNQKTTCSQHDDDDGILPNKDDGNYVHTNKQTTRPSPNLSERIPTDDDVPPYLTFLGSQTFGQVVPLS